MRSTADIREGDIFAFTHGTSIVLKKILRIEREEQDGSGLKPIAVHCLTYESVTEIPPLERIGWLKISSLHSLLPSSALVATTSIGSLPVAPEELVGFLEYLRETDYPRFLDERKGQVTSRPSAESTPAPIPSKTSTEGGI